MPAYVSAEILLKRVDADLSEFRGVATTNFKMRTLFTTVRAYP